MPSISQAGTNYIVIGKIPGYNKNINTKSTIAKDNSKIDYTERLKNNLTTVRLTPTGYKINYSSLNPFSSAPAPSSSTTTPTVVDSTLSKTIYKVGGSIELGFGNYINSSNQTPTKTAVNTWQALVANNVSDPDSHDVNELRILATNDSTMSEVFGNKFETSTIEKMANKIGETKITEVAKMLKKIVTVDSSTGLEMLQGGSNLTNNQFLNMLGGKALGVQTAMPKEWFSSDYNNTLQLMIKLVSPAGDDNSVKEYILKPLLFLILAASPVTYDGVNFGYPTLWNVEADGMMDIGLAGISALIITRGGNDTQFNRHNQPLNVDVRMTIEPLVNGFATPMVSLSDKQFLVPNPTRLKNSMKQGKDSYTTIKL